MKVLCVDTETTGLPQTKIISKELLELWPHIVQFSYLIYDTELNAIIKIKDSILNVPPDVVMGEDVIRIHGITNEMTQDSNIAFTSVIDELHDDLVSIDIIVGHNLSFDTNMIKVELMREKEEEKLREKHKKSRRLLRLSPLNFNNHQRCLDILLKKETYCTMTNSIQLCNIKALSKFGREYVKFPKLTELHYKLFNVTPINLHNSLNDVVVCFRCYFKLRFDIEIMEINNTMREMMLNLL